MNDDGVILSGRAGKALLRLTMPSEQAAVRSEPGACRKPGLRSRTRGEAPVSGPGARLHGVCAGRGPAGLAAGLWAGVAWECASREPRRSPEAI